VFPQGGKQIKIAGRKIRTEWQKARRFSPDIAQQVPSPVGRVQLRIVMDWNHVIGQKIGTGSVSKRTECVNPPQARQYCQASHHIGVA